MKTPKLYVVSQHLPSERTLGGLFFMSVLTQRWWWWGGGKALCSLPSLLYGPCFLLKYLF